jgi:hypothetical protein
MLEIGGDCRWGGVNWISSEVSIVREGREMRRPSQTYIKSIYVKERRQPRRRMAMEEE